MPRRGNFYPHIDEFHHLITPTIASPLSGARKYRLGPTPAHQDLRQFVSRDAEAADAVVANPRTRVRFRVDEADARRSAAYVRDPSRGRWRRLGDSEGATRPFGDRHDHAVRPRSEASSSNAAAFIVEPSDLAGWTPDGHQAEAREGCTRRKSLKTKVCACSSEG